MRQFRGLQLKDWLTLCNAACGLGALLVFTNSYWFAAALVAAAAVFDFLDGKVARKGQPDAFGKELDSLADAVSFVAAPAVMLSVSGGNEMAIAFAAVLFAFAGLVRLARYNLQEEKGVYVGLPVPIAAFVLVVAMPFTNGYAFVLAIALGILMASHVRLKKL
ncbi:Archaetidylserine synthase [Candidatus Norongarragalina meridionalis]|nr:Archaetidylserine synthase [Candidatus Norongarragalina meridionalis]